MSTTTIIILVIILAHLVAGFGFVMYKLAPKKGDTPYDPYDTDEFRKDIGQK